MKNTKLDPIIYNRAKTCIYVAFNSNIEKIEKKSFNKTIDVQFGIYTGPVYTDYLTINLKPSHGFLDWVINFHAWKNKHGYHAGYWKEWQNYKNQFIQVIKDNEILYNAMMNRGVIICGRSKGAAETIIIANELYEYFKFNNYLIGCIEPPKVCSKNIKNLTETRFGVDSIVVTRYKNDIVPILPQWLKFPGTLIQLGKRTFGLSCKDHVISTTDEDEMVKELELLQ